MPAPERAPRSPDELLDHVKTRGRQLRLRRRVHALSGGIGILAVTAVIAAVASDPGGNTSLVAADPNGGTTTTTGAATSSSTSTSTTADDDDGATEEQASPVTSERGPSPTSTTTAPATSNATPATTTGPHAVRGPFDPPRPGTYRYRVELDGSARESRVTYTELGRKDGAARLSERWDDPGAEPTELLWGEQGVLVPNAYSCEEEGFKTRYVFPLTVGTTWSYDNTCSTEDTRTVHTRSSARVTDFAKVTVAGQTTDAWVIATTTTTEITFAKMKQTHHSEATEWFSAAHGLRVKSVVRMRHEPTGDGPSGPSTSEILSLDPR